MELLNKQYRTIKWGEPWREAFSYPERCGTWFIWGNSGNGKSSFVMQLVVELAHFGKVFYNSLEEGTSLTLQQNLQRVNLDKVADNILVGCEPLSDLTARLLGKRAPQFVVIDSLQYAGISFPAYRKFKELHRNKLIIYISHSEGKTPAGRTAKSVRYDADLKIWVEGFKAISNGRYNPGGEYVIWRDGMNKYYGVKETAPYLPINEIPNENIHESSD